MGLELVAIEGDEVVIRVKIDAIPYAASVAFDEEWGFEQHDVKVIDASVFAKEMVSELRREKEDGTTLVDEMLDRACVRAADNGAEGLNEAQ